MGGGGVNAGQLNQSIANLLGIGGTGVNNMNQQYNQMQLAQGKVTPYYSNLMTQGNPFYRNQTDYNAGNIAQAFAPQRAAILRSTSQMTNQPSGYREGLINNLNAAQGRAFDQSLNQAQMAQFLAKQQGAAGLQGQQQLAGNQALGYGSLGAGANQAVMGGPQSGSVPGMIGGALLGGMRTGAQLAAV
jgi:hypothetical protein